MTRQLKTVLVECRFHRHMLLKLLQGDGCLQQLITVVMWKVTRDKLMWIRHKVIIIQLIADNICRHLPMYIQPDRNSNNESVVNTVS